MSNLLDRLDPYKGTGFDGLLQNFLMSPTFALPGSPIGVTVDVNHAPVGLDMTLFKEILEQLEVKDIGVLGEQGFGKTFTVDELLTLLTGIDVGSDSFFRFKMHSLKRNNRGRPETAALIEDFLGCKIIDPFRTRFNPLARAFCMTFDEKYIMLLRLYQYTQMRKLTDAEQQVLKEVLRDLENDLSREPSFPGLAQGFMRYNPEGADEVDRLLAEQRRVREEGGTVPDAEWMTERHLKHRERNFTRLYDAAFSLKLATETFNEGLYASILNGTSEDTEETIRQFSQRAVSIDYKGVPDELRSVLEIVWSRIEMAAETPWPDDPEKKPRKPELIYNAIVTDEAYNDWENPEFVENEYRRKKTQRETGIIGIMIFHRLRDFFEAIGNEITGRKARNAINEIKVWLIGHQNKDALDDIRSFFTLPEFVVQSLPTLAKGHFWLILPGMPPLLIAVIGTETAIKLFHTEDAHSELLKLYFETGDTKYYITYLEKTTPEDTEGDETHVQEEEEELLPQT